MLDNLLVVGDLLALLVLKRGEKHEQVVKDEHDVDGDVYYKLDLQELVVYGEAEQARDVDGVVD